MGCPPPLLPEPALPEGVCNIGIRFGCSGVGGVATLVPPIAGAELPPEPGWPLLLAVFGRLPALGMVGEVPLDSLAVSSAAVPHAAIQNGSIIVARLPTMALPRARRGLSTPVCTIETWGVT